MKRVLIIGGGIAGLSAAALLQEDFHVTIVDKREVLNERIGFIGLWENGLRVLEKIGIKEQIQNEAYEPPFLKITDESDQSIFSIHRNVFSRFLGRHIVVDRHVLQRHLKDAANGIELMLGKAVVQLNQKNNEVIVEFNDKTVEAFDLVVAADGVHSQIRSTLHGIHEQSYGWNVWVSTLPQSVFSNIGGANLVFGKQYYCFIIPGKNHGWLMCGAPKQVSHAEKLDIHQQLQSVFKEASTTVRSAIDQVQIDQIYQGDTTQVRMPVWHSGHITFIGDAQHAVMPLLGFGGCIAMEDAMVLAETLKPTLQNAIPLGNALQNFASQRRRRVRHFQNTCDLAWKMVAIKSNWIRSIRNKTLYLLLPIFALLRMRKVRCKSFL